MSILDEFILSCKYIIYALMPIKKKTVMFESFYGQFNDNPKYILLKLHKIYPEAKIYLAVSDKHSLSEKVPDYVIPVQYGSFKHKFLQCRCQVFVTNLWWIIIPNTFILAKLFYKIIVRKQKLTISTWHGTPIKKLGLDDLSSGLSQSVEYRVLMDFVIAGCKYTSNILSTCMQRTELPVILTGTPRNDILLHEDIDLASIKDKLKLPRDKKILLFAPTFRINTFESGVHQIQIFEIHKILDACYRNWGDEWVFVYRLHSKVFLEIDMTRYESPQLINGNIGDDMAEYLACTDILITDYSSSMFDFALTGKPCFLFAPDREHYEKKERGFYLDYDSLPFPISYTNEELIKNIQEFDDVAYRERVSRFLEEIGNVEDGKASERIAECIVHFLRTGEKRLRTIDDYNGQGEY